jgi:hypothetical protein
MGSCDPLDRMMNSLRIKLTGATDDAIRLALFDVMDEHFRKTNCWRYEIEVPLQVGDRRYPIIAPSETALVRVLDVSYAGRPVAPIVAGASSSSQRGRLIADEQFPDNDAVYWADEQIPSGNNFRYAIYYPTYVTLDIAPSQDAVEYPIRFILALSLSQGCMECDCDDWSVDEWMYDRYYDDWQNGVLGYMYASHAKPYSNATLALMHLKKFNAAIAFARQEALRGFVFDQPRWRYPRVGSWISRGVYR